MYLMKLFNNFVSQDFLNEIITKNTNADIAYGKIKIKTHIKPDITVYTDELKISDKSDNYTFLHSYVHD